MSSKGQSHSCDSAIKETMFNFLSLKGTGIPHRVCIQTEEKPSSGLTTPPTNVTSSTINTSEGRQKKREPGVVSLANTDTYSALSDDSLSGDGGSDAKCRSHSADHVPEINVDKCDKVLGAHILAVTKYPTCDITL